MKDASSLYSLRKDAPPDGEALARRAQSDFAPVIDALWGAGYYNAKVTIAIDGAAVAIGSSDIAAFARAAGHQHPQEQFVWVIKGTIDLRIGGEERTIKPQDIAVIPGGVEHEAFFPEDTAVIDFFAPVREGLSDGRDPALHGAALNQVEPRLCGQERAGVFARARAMGLEGIVLKRVGSAYWSGNCRSRTEAKNPSFCEARPP